MKNRALLPLADRLAHRPEDNVVFVNFEALRLMTPDDVRALAEFLDQRLSAWVRESTALSTMTTSRSATMPLRTSSPWSGTIPSKFFLSLTRYSTNAFYRRQLRKKFTRASLTQQIYPGVAEVKERFSSRPSEEDGS